MARHFEHAGSRDLLVNVALAQIKMGAEFVRDVKECLERYKLKPSDLELDVTEHVLARSTLCSETGQLIKASRRNPRQIGRSAIAFSSLRVEACSPACRS